MCTLSHTASNVNATRLRAWIVQLYHSLLVSERTHSLPGNVHHSGTGGKPALAVQSLTVRVTVTGHNPCVGPWAWAVCTFEDARTAAKEQVSHSDCVGRVGTKTPSRHSLGLHDFLAECGGPTHNQSSLRRMVLSGKRQRVEHQEVELVARPNNNRPQYEKFSF